MGDCLVVYGCDAEKTKKLKRKEKLWLWSVNLLSAEK